MFDWSWWETALFVVLTGLSAFVGSSLGHVSARRWYEKRWPSTDVGLWFDVNVLFDRVNELYDRVAVLERDD